MKGRLLLDVVVGEGASVLQLLAGENESLLVGRNSLFVLKLTNIRRKIFTIRPLGFFLG